MAEQNKAPGAPSSQPVAGGGGPSAEAISPKEEAQPAASSQGTISEALAGKLQREQVKAEARDKQVEGWFETPLGVFHFPEGMIDEKGELRSKRKNTSVSDSHSISEVHEYVYKMMHVDGVAKIKSPHKEQPYEPIEDYIATLRNACTVGGPFLWPSSKMSFQMAQCTALHMCLQAWW